MMVVLKQHCFIKVMCTVDRSLNLSIVIVIIDIDFLHACLNGCKEFVCLLVFIRFRNY